MMFSFSQSLLLGDNVFVVRNISSNDSVEEITNLLHRAYKRLADMGLRFVATYQNHETTLERLESGYCFIATEHERLVGTLTLYPCHVESKCELYARSGVWHFGQFAVDPSVQGIGLGGALLQCAEEFAAKRGAVCLAFDTAEPALHLIAYYTNRGYCFKQHIQWDATNYRSVVMAKSLRKA